MTTRKWGTEIQVSTIVTSDQHLPSVAALQDGGYVVVWQSVYVPPDEVGISTIHLQRFDAAGAAVGPERILLGTWEAQSDPSVTVLSDGNVFVTQTDRFSTDHDVMGNVYTADGTLVRTQNVNFSALDQYGSEAAALGAGSVVAFSDESLGNGSEVFVKGFNADGTVRFNSVLVNDASTNYEYVNSVASSPDGSRFVVIYSYSFGTFNQYATYARVFDSFGSPISDQFNLSIFKGDGDVVWLDNNRFVTVYSDEVQPASGAQFEDVIVFQLWNAQGIKLSDPQAINTFHSGQKTQPQIAALKDGGFAVVWADGSGLGGDSSVTGIKMQVFDSSGLKTGAEILVNTTTVGYQIDPQIAALADGRLIVTWRDGNLGSGPDTVVRSQIIDPRTGAIYGSDNAAIVETLYGNDFNNDEINGLNGNDTIYGMGGTDLIFGGGGADRLNGDRGDDTLYGDGGSDSIFGGLGDDTINGGADGDIVHGDLGDDELFGGDGNDIIYSFGGADLMDGGAGTGDSVFYVNERSAVTINLVDQILNAGAAFGDTITNIERVYGAVYFTNNLTGDANSNILVGGIRNDTLNGGGNFDILRGGLGADMLTGGTSGDYFQYTTAAEGGDTITAWEAGDKFTFTRAAFGNLAGANVAAANFLSVASGHAATNASQKFIFDQATDQLWYDADGSGAGAAIFIADITTNYNLLNTDLLLA
jgi:Ca2+-binding RTX toxin-like protein